jgi:hypothetical protein
LIGAASSAVVALAAHLLLPHNQAATAGLLLVGAAATYLNRRAGQTLRWSPAQAAIAQTLGTAGWQRENARLAVSCASIVLLGGACSLIVRAWVERTALAITTVMGLSSAGPIQFRQALADVAGPILGASRILLLVPLFFMLFGIALASGRQAVIDALPADTRAAHFRFERCLCPVYFGIAIILGSLEWLVIIYDLLVLLLWWMGGRRVEETLLDEGLAARGSAEEMALLYFAGTLVYIPAALALVAEPYGSAQYAFAACHLLLPAIPLILARCAYRFWQGTASLVIALVTTAALIGLGLYVGLRFPQYNPAGSLVLDVMRESVGVSAPATRAAMLARMDTVSHLVAVVVIFVSVMLYPPAVLQALSERWLYSGRLSQWYGHQLLSYALFVGSMAFLGQFAISRIVNAVLYKAPELSSMAIVHPFPLFHILGVLVFLALATVGWVFFKGLARAGLSALSNVSASAREVTLEAQWQRASAYLAVGSIVASAVYGTVLFAGTTAQTAAMESQVVREQAEVRQAVDAGDWRRVALMAKSWPTGEARMEALLAIGSHSRADLLDVVTSALSDPNPDVSATALTTCAYLGDPRALPEVVAWRSSASPSFQPFVDLAITRLTETSRLQAQLRRGQISRSAYARMSRKSLEAWSAEDARLRRRPGSAK